MSKAKPIASSDARPLNWAKHQLLGVKGNLKILRYQLIPVALHLEGKDGDALIAFIDNELTEACKALDRAAEAFEQARLAIFFDQTKGTPNATPTEND